MDTRIQKGIRCTIIRTNLALASIYMYSIYFSGQIQVTRFCTIQIIPTNRRRNNILMVEKNITRTQRRN